VLLIGVGLGVFLQYDKAAEIKGILGEGAKRVGESIKANGCVTQNAESSIAQYLQNNGMDPSRVYFKASTGRQGYGSTAANGALGYDFTIEVPGFNLPIYKMYLEKEVPNVNSDYVTGMAADTSTCLGSFSSFGGVQMSMTDLGPSPITDVNNPSIATTLTLSGPSSVIVGQNAQYSGVVYMGSTLAPAGTQVEVSSPNGVTAVSTQADGSFVFTTSFPSVGPQLLAVTAGIGTASQPVTVTVSAAAQIILTNTSGDGSGNQGSNFLRSFVTDSSNYQTTIGTSVTIQGIVVDANGNPIPSAIMNVTSDTPDVPTQTVKTNYQGAFSLTYTPKSLDTQHVTFTIGAATITATVDILQGTPQTITLQSSISSTYSSSPLTISAGQSVNFQGNVTGLYNSPVAGVNIAMASPTDGVDNFAPNGTLSTDEWGSYTNLNIVLTQAGTQSIQAFAAGISTPAQIQVNVNPGVAAKVANLTANPTQIGAGGTVTVTGQIQDGYGNPVQAGTAIVLIGPDTTTNVTTQSGGQFTATQKVSSPGMATLKVQYSGLTLSGGTVAVNVLPTGAYSLTVNPSVSSVSAGGSLTATIILKDNTGTPIAGKSITLSESPESSALVTTQVMTDAGGQAVVTIAPVTKVGYESLTATMDGVSNVIGTATFQVVPGAANQVVANVSPSLTQLNPPVAPTVIGTLMDAYGNILSNATVSVTGGYGPSSSGTIDVNGNFNIALQAQNLGIWPLTITSGSWSISPSGMTLTVSALVNDSLTLSFASGSTTVGQAVQAIATLTDASGKPVQGETVTFNTPGDTISVLSPQSATTDSQGKAVTNVTFTNVGMESLIAQYQNVAVSAAEIVTQIDLSSQSTAQLANEIKVNNLNISPAVCGVNPPSAANYPIVSGQLVDQYNNPISNISLQLAGGWGGSASVTTSSTGYFSVPINPVNIGTFYPTISSGNFTYTSSTVSLKVSSNQSYYQITISAPASTTIGAPTNVTYTITDQSGNPISNIIPTVTSDDAGFIASSMTASNSSGQGTFNIAFDTTGEQGINLSYQGVQASASVDVNDVNLQGGTGVIPNGYTLQVASLSLAPSVVSLSHSAYFTGILQLKNISTNVLSPVINAVVTANGNNGGWGNTATTLNPTDINGSFVIPIDPSITGTFGITLSVGANNFATGLSLQVVNVQAYTLSVNAPTSVTVGTTNNVTATLCDATGTPVVGQTLTITSPTEPSATITMPTPTDTDGKTTVSVTWSQTGNQIVTATYQNVQSSAVVKVIPIDPENPPLGVTISYSFIQTNLSPLVISTGQGAIFTGKLVDNFSNPVPNAIVAASTTGNWGTTPITTTLSDGTFSMSITPTLTGSFPISLVTGAMTPISTGLTLTVSPTQGYTMQFVTATNPATVGVNTSCKIKLLDQSGNAVVGVQPIFSSPTDITATSVTGSATDSSGYSTISTFIFDKSGIQTMLATWPAQSNVSCAAAVTVNAGAPMKFVNSSIAPSQVQVGSTAIITGTVEDNWSNLVTSGTVTVAVTSGTSETTANGTIQSNGSFTATVSAITAGTVNTFTLTDGSATATVGPLTVVPKAATLTLTPQTGTPIADLSSGFPIVANIKDGSGNPIQNIPVTFVVSPNALAGFSANPTTTDASGNASPTITFTQTGDQSVTATCTVNGQTLSANMYVYVSSPVLSNIVWTSVTPTTVTAGNTVSITGQALDQFGHGMPDGTAVTLSMPGSNATNTTVYTYHSGSTYGLFNGSLTPTRTGSWALYSGNGQNAVLYSSAVTVTPTSAGEITLSYTSTYTQLLDGDSVSLMANIADGYGNPIPNQSIHLSITGAGAPTLTQPPPTDSNGNTTVTEGPFPAGGYQITGSLGSVVSQPLSLSVASQIATTVTVNITPDPLPSMSSTWTCCPGNTLPCDLSASGDPFVINVNVLNQRGLPMPGAIVTVTPTGITGNGGIVQFQSWGYESYSFGDSHTTATIGFTNFGTYYQSGPTYTSGTYQTDQTGSAYITMNLNCDLNVDLWSTGISDFSMSGHMNISVNGMLEKQWSFSIH
jgi:adhesin/invasin